MSANHTRTATKTASGPEEADELLFLVERVSRNLRRSDD
jgi:hypothetical protein